MPITYTTRRPKNWDLWPDRPLTRDRFVHDSDDWKDFPLTSDDNYWYSRPRIHHIRRQSDESADVVKEDNGFKVKLDVSHFKPEEICVKYANKDIVVTGKHDEVRDKHGFVSRQFSRRYPMPEEFDSSKLVSTLSSDGILEIKAPVRQPKVSFDTERVVPITHI